MDFNEDCECRLDSSASEQGLVARSCEHGNEPSGCTKFWEFLACLRSCWLLMKNSVPWNWRVHGTDTHVQL
jgi:hypothetical protein